MEITRNGPSELIANLRVSRLRSSLCALGVSEIQIVYSAFESYPFASLTVFGRGIQTAPIGLPLPVHRALRRLFYRRLALTYPGWPDNQVSGGIVLWNLDNNTRSHQHFGYGPHFFERKEVMTSRSNDRTPMQPNP